MKVLQVINNLSGGGAEKLLEDLVPLMNEYDDIEMDILLLTDEKNVFERILRAKKIKIFVIKYKNIHDLRNICEIRKYIIEGGYDIVHSHLFPTQYWVSLSTFLIKDKNIKFITTEHNTYNRRRNNIFFRIIDKIIYAQYSVVVSITKQTRDNLVKWIGFNKKEMNKHIVIENGVNLETIDKAFPYKKNELIKGIGESTKLVCMVGRFSEQKDQPTLIKAMFNLPENVKLILVGEGKLLEESRKLVENLQMKDKVHFMGFRKDIPRILKTMDIIVLSSHWEGFGIAAVEGMAAKKPVLGSDVDGLSGVLSGAGILFPKGDVENLTIKLREIIDDEFLYNEVAEACLARSKEFSIERMAKKYYELLNTL